MNKFTSTLSSLAFGLMATIGTGVLSEAKAGPTCGTRQLGERCTATSQRVDAGSCSKQRGCDRRTEWIMYVVPTGYAVTSWRLVDENWNGGTINAKNGSRGQRINIKSEYSRFDSQLNDYQFKLDALRRDAASIKGVEAKAEAERKIAIAEKELREAKTQVSQVGQYDSNIDYIEMQAHSWYECHRKLFGSCVDGAGNHGKGHVVVELVFIGDSAILNSRVSNISGKLSDATAAVENGKNAPVPQPDPRPQPKPDPQPQPKPDPTENSKLKEAIKKCKQTYPNGSQMKKCIKKAKREYGGQVKMN